ncbi:glycosyl hydrolase family 18 protein, partial [Catellatospora sp. NPDC049609]|uniref:glycosyl hydrolase family 18 protein n=1 Tax=Catellatospora sp. NPDC049609 TaxID=3155505 RepID=UPI00342AE223
MGVSLTISSSASAANLIANPGLESGSLSPWSCSAGLGSVVTTPVHAGTRALQGAPNAGNHAQCSQTVTVLPNTAYVLSAWVRGGGGYVYLGYTGGTETWNPAASGAWTKLSLNLTTGASQTSLTVNVHGWYGQPAYQADDFSLDGPGTPPSNPPTPTVAPSSPRPPSASPSAPPSNPPSQSPPPPGGRKLLGYFVNWGVYQRAYHVKNIATSGSAAKLTHINYAFGNVSGGACTIGDAYADYDRAYTAAESIDGVADTWDAGALRGSFNQLRKLKRQYPNIKILWSFGGWTWSGGFGQAAANPTAF